MSRLLRVSPVQRPGVAGEGITAWRAVRHRASGAASPEGRTAGGPRAVRQRSPRGLRARGPANSACQAVCRTSHTSQPGTPAATRNGWAGTHLPPGHEWLNGCWPRGCGGPAGKGQEGGASTWRLLLDGRCSQLGSSTLTRQPTTGAGARSIYASGSSHLPPGRKGVRLLGAVPNQPEAPLAVLAGAGRFVVAPSARVTACVRWCRWTQVGVRQKLEASGADQPTFAALKSAPLLLACLGLRGARSPCASTHLSSNGCGNTAASRTAGPSARRGGSARLRGTHGPREPAAEAERLGC